MKVQVMRPLPNLASMPRATLNTFVFDKRDKQCDAVSILCRFQQHKLSRFRDEPHLQSKQKEKTTKNKLGHHPHSLL